jgi:hypothetical protein
MSALIDSHKRLQIEYNNRPIRDANSKKIINDFRSIGLAIFVTLLCEPGHCHSLGS